MAQFNDCASHRFNLAVNHYIAQNEELVEKVAQICKKMRTIKNSAKLRKFTPLRPILRNVTRWSSTFNMLSRYLELKQYIDQIQEENELDIECLSARDLTKLKLMLRDMTSFDSVTIKLQSNDIDIYQVRILFDAIIDQFPGMDRYLSKTANIIHSPAFENALVKLIKEGDRAELSNNEIDSLNSIKVMSQETPVEEDDVNTPENFAEKALKKAKIVKLSGFLNPKFLVPTSNIVERLNSCSKITLGDLRKSLLPRHLEMILFLRTNRQHWDLSTVATVVNRK